MRINPEPPPGLGRTQGWWFWVDTTLTNCSTMFILSGGLHLRLDYMPIVELIAQKLAHSPHDHLCET